MNCPEISHCIVTADKGGPIGKLAALKSECRPTAHICHIDDSDVVLRDFKSEHARRDGWNVHPLGIRVPRSGRRRPQIRVEEVEYFNNLLEILEHLAHKVDIAGLIILYFLCVHYIC